MDNPYDLTTRPIPQLIMKLAVPSSVGFFFNTMFNVVDTYFGGLISTQALAALSLSLSVFFMIIAIISVISIQELTFQGMELMSATYLTFEIWITITVLYFVLTFSCSLVMRYLELSMQKHSYSAAD